MQWPVMEVFLPARYGIPVAEQLHEAVCTREGKSDPLAPLVKYLFKLPLFLLLIKAIFAGTHLINLDTPVAKVIIKSHHYIIFSMAFLFIKAPQTIYGINHSKQENKPE